MSKTRLQQSDEQKEADKSLDKSRKSKTRSQQSDEQKEADKSLDKSRKTKTRSEQSDEQKEADKAHAQTRMSKRRAETKEEITGILKDAQRFDMTDPNILSQMATNIIRPNSINPFNKVLYAHAIFAGNLSIEQMLSN